MKKVLALIIVLSAAFMLHAEDATPKCSGKPQDQTIIGAVKWYRDSAEQKALYREIYAVATRYIEDKVKSDDLKPGTWGVSIDIDETTLDNSWYFKNCTEVADDENDFSEFVVKPELSKALPGVIDFTKKVHELGGYVSMVSNRDGSYKYKEGGVLEATLNNLKKEGIYFDQVVLANRKDSKTPSDKNPRFKSIESGEYDAAQMVWSNKLPAHKLIVWCGDNIQDFPVFKQKNLIGVPGSSDTFDHFSNGYFIFPNPIYGSWQSNEYK